MAKKLIKAHNDRKASRSNWDSFWEDIGRFVIPNKEDVFTLQNRATGDRKHHKLYDSSAVHFNELLANTLHSMLTNPSQVWLELNARDKKINLSPAVRKYLQEVAELMIQMLNNSNFQPQVHEVYMDLGSFGTGVLGVFEDDETVFRFDSKPIYHFYVEENSKGIVNTLSTVDKITVEDAFEKFGEKAFGDEADRLKKNMQQKIEILNTVMPRKKADRFGVGKLNKPFSNTFVWVEKEMIVQEGGFDSFPFMVPRFMKVSDEKYGRSPGMKALPDIKMLNSMMKTTLRGAQKVVDPPLAIPDDGFLGRVNTTPGGLNPYRAGTTDRIFPIETKGNIGLGLDLMNDVRERVKQHFFIDQLQLREGPQMTATEVNARVEVQLRLLGPLLGRLHSEFLQPMVARLLDIMSRKNLLPKNPPAELVGGNFELEVFFTSQIAKAQRLGEADNLTRFLSTMEGIVQFDPKAADNIDIDKVTKKLAVLNGVPEDIFNDEETVEELREQRAEAQAAAQQQEQELAGAEVLNKAAGPVQDMMAAGGG